MTKKMNKQLIKIILSFYISYNIHNIKIVISYIIILFMLLLILLWDMILF